VLWVISLLVFNVWKIISIVAVFVIFLCYWVRLIFAEYAYVLTDSGVADCIRFSWNLTKGKSWFVFKASLILIVPLFFIPWAESLWIFPLLYGMSLFDYLKTNNQS
jgi:membrane-anchored glycerophosphoryl diester phosphodiesterase (GDPDase)